MQENTPVPMKDNQFQSKHRTVLTREQICIPGIEMIGRHTIKSALPPLELHYHPDCFELTFVLEGTIAFGTEQSDEGTGEKIQKEYHLNGGDIFVTFPDEVHSSNMMPVLRSEIIWFQLDVSRPEEMLFLEPQASSDLLKRMCGLKGHVFRMKTCMYSLIKDAFQSVIRGQSPQLSASYLALILNLMTEEIHPQENALSEDIRQSAQYIRRNLTQQLSLDELAELCGLSVSSYKQKFKSQMGITPRNYINMQKIELAKQFLKSGESVTETSMKLGFNTSSYFTTVFKKYTSQSPADYAHKKQPASFSESLRDLDGREK
ncbi:hypothetical protein B5F07_18130 [Lachnoclostridium sp. An169]|uniref:AraC family transcriptional regulator n=1 Tax=Lachnoclostridium sp. An169 TaxID=1965569 RepID=UPI000B368A59|nr:AraC family transcriptional regulator [Lachnoclostridium sp. An169]OUP81275.1 hypothetical protein B5F07_18130 [Lachnoclostridium sp. An169]